MAHAQTRLAEVLYTHHDETPQKAFRVGDECFVPVDSVHDWGWEVTVKDNSADVKAEGQILHVSLRSILGKKSIPLRKALETLGGTSRWSMGTDTLEVLSDLKSISVKGGKIDFEATLGVKTNVFFTDSPSRMVFDIAGAKLGTKTVQDLTPDAKVTQYKPGVVRVVVETKFVPELPKDKLDETRIFDFEIKAAPDLNPKPVVIPEVKIPDIPNTGQPLPPGQLNIGLQSESPESSVIRLDFRNLIHGDPSYKKLDPSTLEIRIGGLNQVLAEPLQLGLDGIVATARVEGSTTILTLAFPRPMGAQVYPDASGVQIQLLKPNIGDGKLSSKIIVVDPGHGGHDSGAHAAGVMEKDLNLAYGKLLARKLASEGATVILTRSTDVFITLEDRPAIAAKANADFFISCHTNSTGGNGGQSGATTYYHMQNGTCRLLGECIQSEIAKVSGIHDNGVKSDKVIYKDGGFSVLRNAKMPALLLEMGFVDNGYDRKRIVTPAFQEAITSAVVKGLKVYLGDAKPSK